MLSIKKKKRSSNDISVSTTATNSLSTFKSSGNSQNFQYKDGRKYHKDAKVAYVFPCDDDGMFSRI
jgi:hypothetical protein